MKQKDIKSLFVLLLESLLFPDAYHLGILSELLDGGESLCVLVLLRDGTGALWLVDGGDGHDHASQLGGSTDFLLLK